MVPFCMGRVGAMVVFLATVRTLRWEIEGVLRLSDLSCPVWLLHCEIGTTVLTLWTESSPALVRGIIGRVSLTVISMCVTASGSGMGTVLGVPL